MTAVQVPDIATLRVEYESEGIDPATMADDPLDEFVAWLSVAVSAGVMEANAFVLATATPDGGASAPAGLQKNVGPHRGVL